MKYILLTVFIISVCIISYYLYAYFINKKLNIKKKSLFENKINNPYKNKLKLSYQLSVLLCFITVVLFVTPNNTSVVVGFSDEVQMQDIVSKCIDVGVEKEETIILERFNINNLILNNKTIETEENLYIQEDNRLTKLDLLTNEITSYEYEEKALEQDMFINNDKIVTYRNCLDKSYLYIYEANDLDKYENITIPHSKIKSVFIKDRYIDVFFDCNPNEAIDGRVKMIDSFNNEYNNDYQDSSYIKEVDICNIMTHAKIDIKNRTAKLKSIYLNNYFACYEDEYAYLATNMKDDTNSDTINFKRCALLKYNMKDMKVQKTTILGGSIYSKPTIVDNQILTNVVIEGKTTNSFTTYTTNKYLEISEVKTIELTKDEVLGTTPEYNYVVTKNNKQYKVINGQEIDMYNCFSEYDGLLEDDIIRVENTDNRLIITILNSDENLVSRVSGIPEDASILKIKKEVDEELNEIVRILLVDEKNIYFILINLNDGQVHRKVVLKEEYQNMYLSNNYVITKEDDKYSLYNLFDNGE